MDKLKWERKHVNLHHFIDSIKNVYNSILLFYLEQ